MASKSKKTVKPKKASKPKTEAKPKAGVKPQKGAKPKKAATTKATTKPKTETKPKADTLAPKNVTKTLTIMAALKSEKGVTIDEMVKMTDWQPHTARAYLSGVRKKLSANNEGTQLVKYTRDGKTMYKLEDAGQE